MKLYGISQEDVLNVLRGAKTQTTSDDKIFLDQIKERFSYPIKVISAYRGPTLVIISAYSFKRKKNESKLR